MLFALLACAPTGSLPEPDTRCDVASCPEIAVDGDPPAESGFRGYGDPSFARDPEDGSLWMAYSWLDAGTDPADHLVRTHLAQLEDGAFVYRGTANTAQRGTHPENRRDGWTLHEVPTLVRRADDWALWTLDYFEPSGTAFERGDFRIALATADSPARLDAGVPVLRGTVAPNAIGGVDARDLGLNECAVLTEPGALTHDGATWLAATCLPVGIFGVEYRRSRLVLFRSDGEALEPVGDLLDGEDARAFGAKSLEQAQLAVARDGTVLLVVTPLGVRSEQVHEGCMVLEIEDLAAARLRRNDDGTPFVRHYATGPDDVFGPGLCTYDTGFDGGLVMVLTRFDLEADPPDLRFSMHATGVHP
ncbi:MAG: hypothetical protein H6737_14905 [Alphaproteobacteria bacterium]|nr:hypothetical protein [Alphaproteobacteria bacterium]